MIKQKSTKKDTQDTLSGETLSKDETQATPKAVQTSEIKPKKSIQIVRKGDEEPQKVVAKTQTENKKEQSSTATIETTTKDTQISIQPKPIESTPTTEVKKDSELPQGIDPSQLRKPRISAIRVISKNDEAQTTSKKKDETNSSLRSATQILDTLKNVERKEKVKKKKDKSTKNHSKSILHILSVWNAIWGALAMMMSKMKSCLLIYMKIIAQKRALKKKE